MRRIFIAMLWLSACVLPEWPTYEERFLADAGEQPIPDSGTGGGGGGGGFDAGPVPMCGETLALDATELMTIAVRAASCGVTEGTAVPGEWPRLMLDWSRVLQRAPDYEGRPGTFVDALKDPCARLKCLSRSTDCTSVFACYGGVELDAGTCSADSCTMGKAMHCDATRGPAWIEDCAGQNQQCQVDTTGHAACGTTCPAAQGMCIANNAALARCNSGVGRTYECSGRCVAGAGGTAVCAPASGGDCTGNVCEGDVAVDCPTRTFGDRVDCAGLPGGTCRQLPGSGPVFCAPKTGAACSGTLSFYTSCDGNTLVVCGNNVESRIDCTALGFSSCFNAGPAGYCQ